MKKTYQQKITDLLNAVDALGGLLDGDMNAVKPWKTEIDALHESARAINENRISPVFVSVRGGVVTLVSDESGEAHPFPVIIDYDQYDSGVCPVCGSDFDDDQPCQNCGYDASKDNGLECAVKYYTKG